MPAQGAEMTPPLPHRNLITQNNPCLDPSRYLLMLRNNSTVNIKFKYQNVKFVIFFYDIIFLLHVIHRKGKNEMLLNIFSWEDWKPTDLLLVNCLCKLFWDYNWDCLIQYLDLYVFLYHKVFLQCGKNMISGAFHSLCWEKLNRGLRLNPNGNEIVKYAQL